MTAPGARGTPGATDTGDPVKVSLTRLQAAIAGLALAAAGAVGGLALPGGGSPNGKKCVEAVQAFYANERTGGNPGSIDTLLYVPLQGRALDSLARLDSFPDGSPVQTVPDSISARSITICVDSLTAYRAVLQT